MIPSTAPGFGRWLSALTPPSRCEVCGTWPSKPHGSAVCAPCLAALGPVLMRCPTCALVLPLGAQRCAPCSLNPPTLQACVAAVDYAFPWSDLLARFKFRAEPGWAALLARLVWQSPGAATLLAGSDWVVPAPLSRARLGERGYNQAWELASALSHLATIPRRARPDLLLRLAETPLQHTLNRADRLHNLRSAFAVSAAGAEAVQGRRIALVDDIMTTGATLESAAAALRQAGAREVVALVVARTPSPNITNTHPQGQDPRNAC